MNGIAIALGLASAAFFAVSSVLEQQAAKRERPTRTIDPRLLIRLLHRRLWLFGSTADAFGTVLQALALRFGALALVEPLLVSGLFMAIPLEAAIERRRPHRRDLLVVLLGVVGLTGFLLAANPRGGVTEPKTLAWIGVTVAVGTLVTICLLVAWRTQDATRGLMLGIATGLLYAMAAALVKTVIEKLPEQPGEIFTNWHVYALVLVGGTALTLNQNAFQGGPIAAPLTAIALLDPFGGVLIGVFAFEERLSLEGPRLFFGLVAVAAMVIGIWMARRTQSR
ncbi:DMT family transporter [Micromonospora sp. WMMD1102]|uniref:DMT family transporter n=1 Tax=Micromonospora sp. WMMD1102 TaxID=3016105 RepID=UPI002414EB87|nr:DMT family transporter [Micromonospora sp. WMMD1102]MDG4787436.1 DMT family transporter [Micromonospora sp. WMMD1102]